MRIRPPKKSVLTGAVAALGVCSLVLAFIAPGVEETKVDLNDGGVWVTSTSKHLVARLHYPPPPEGGPVGGIAFCSTFRRVSAPGR